MLAHHPLLGLDVFVREVARLLTASLNLFQVLSSTDLLPS